MCILHVRIRHGDSGISKDESQPDANRACSRYLRQSVPVPVMIRISREEEMFIGRARPAIFGQTKVGFPKDGSSPRAPRRYDGRKGGTA